MKQAAAGDTVHIHYKGTLEDGGTFDSSEGRDPLEITLGSGQVLPGVESALTGMAEGETKNISLGAAEAFGEHNPELVQNVERAQIPAEIQLEVGGMLQATDETGNPIRLVIVEFDDTSVTLDANHPLAGKDLNFELTLVGFA